MPRRREVPQREVPPEPVYGSGLGTQFINSMMKDGKRTVAARTFYTAMERIQDKTGDDPVKIFKKAVDNVKPAMEVKSRRVGGATYQVPVEVRPARRNALAIRWLIGYARSRSEHSMADKLAAEFLAASKNEGASIKKREDTHKMAEANKAFAHFRW